MAINEVHEKRPGSIETKEPENAVKGGRTPVLFNSKF